MASFKSNRAAGEACWKPMGSLCCWGHAHHPNCSTLPSASALQQKSKEESDLHSRLKKYTTSYLGPLSSRSVKYSLIKYSLAKKYSRDYDTDQTSVINMLVGICCLWPVFTTIFQGTEVFQGLYELPWKVKIKRADWTTLSNPYILKHFYQVEELSTYRF